MRKGNVDMCIETRERETAIHLVNVLVEKGICNARNGSSMEDLFFSELYKFGFHMSSGMTKACFTHEDLDDWVIKVGFTGSLSKDYARVEYENYKAAVNCGLEWYFPFTEFLCEIDGMEFFIQESAECCEDAITSNWYDLISALYEESGRDLEEIDIWDEVYELEDADKIDLMFNEMALNSFLREHRIGDLHEGNFGFIGDRTVIIDFSGYAG
jgi:hypothetical protein